MDVAHLEEMQSAVPTRWEIKKEKKIQKININKNEKKTLAQDAVCCLDNIRKTIKTQIRKKRN